MYCMREDSNIHEVFIYLFTKNARVIAPKSVSDDVFVKLY